MWKRCTYLVFLITILALIPGSALFGFDAKKDPALMGYWSFDEGKGTVAADSSPFKRNGTLQGSATWGPGRFGSGIVFNGTNASVSVPNWQLTTDKITMVAWIKGWKAADWAAIISGQPTRLELGFGDNNTLRYTWNGDSSATWGWAGGPVIPQDTWALVAVTLDPTKAVEYVYSDQGGLTQATNAIAHISQTFTQLTFGFSFDPRYFRGTMDEVAIYSRALTQEEILSLTKGPGNPALATAPSPADKATDVPRDTALAWKAGPYAGTHDVYLGTAFADVNSASQAKPAGVLAGPGQTAATYTPAAPLDFGQTYYWRVDEVNKAPTSTVFKGEVWSFTVEPYSYPITGVIATASSNQNGMGPENTVNGSGMTGDTHGADPMTMWMSKGTLPNWIQYQFDNVYKLDKLLVWNSNQMIEAYIGFGAKDVTVEYSVDGTTWTALAGVPPFAQGAGSPTYAANTTVNFAGAMAKYVKLTINKSWGGLPSTGLAEVRFTSIPVQARAPQPAAGGTGAGVSTVLNWRPGREATSHQVFFGTDANAVANGTVSAKTVTAHSFDPGALTFGTKYYWKVDEIGGSGPYAGSVWSFTTQEFAVVDDMESYNDTDNCIFDTWIDGFADGKSNSVVGYDKPPFAEQAIVHGGKQSMPMSYDNTKTPFYSEAVQTFASPLDWTGNGATHLGVWFRGYPAVTSIAVTETASKMSLTGDGTDIWNTSDDFVFAYKTLTGDGSMVARVTSNGTGTNTWAKGGVMIRDSLNGGSTFVNMAVTGSAGNGASFQFRPVANAACGTATDSAAVVAPPYWVKIERKGDAITGYVSTNGTTWSMQGTPQTIVMTTPVYIGLCMTSHAAGEQRTFQFDSISSTGGVSGSWQGAQINSPRYNDAAGLYAIVEDSSGGKKIVPHPNPAAAATGTWTLWPIPLSDLTSAGVKTTKIKKLTIGVGDRNSPKAGGTGMLYLDDIGYGHPAK